MEEDFSVDTVIPHDIGALIFDCDGTLVDTMEAHIAAWVEILKVIGTTWTPNWSAYNGMPTSVILQEIAKEFQLDIDTESLAKTKEEIAHRMLNRVRPIPQVVEVARKFRGSRPLAVVSGGVRANVTKALSSAGIVDWFEVIITADDGYRAKPAPDMFLEVARRLNVAPAQCAVFEDGEPGLEGARQAGMLAIDVRPFILDSAVAESRISLKAANLRCGASLKYRILRSPNG